MGSMEQPSTSLDELRQICALNGPPQAAKEALLHHVIGDQVRIRPDELAINAWDGDLTYAELDRAAANLAVRLAQAGVQPDVVVPLAFGKSKYMIVAMLAVLKAGGAFCPLEPGQPPAITANIIEKVNAKVCLCSMAHLELLETIAPKQQLLIVDEKSVKPVEAGTTTIKQPTGSDAAYVFFTSGSTGVPKGCINVHSAASVGFPAQGKAMHFRPGYRVLHRATFCFDSCLLETMVTLVSGGTICIPTELAFRENPTKAMADYSVNWALFAPAFLGKVVRSSIPSLQTLILAVEPMSDYHIEEWTKQVTLCNAYGLTECTVVSTVNSDVRPRSNPRNIGKPVAVHTWIVDANDMNRLAPIGAMGELVLSGPTLGRGYLNDPKQTNEAYRPSPEWMPSEYRAVDSRVFRTGDLVKYDSDGSIICLGRKANLSVYNGTPIIAHEMEFYLQTALPSVAQFVCEILEIPGLGETLVAFVDFKTDPLGKMTHISGEDSAKLGQILHKKIPADLQAVAPYPDNCWPAVFVPCWILPKKWSGKPNRVELRKAGERLTDAQLAAFRRGWDEKLSFEPQPQQDEPWVLNIAP
ncbi:hypothetical protein AMS68_002765 [Peltaster fructicola]|uniref:AMP-dependent synthetase/ligase domain-containing protein n=1 Tax=Peltaster fructicola TaxID=286661 RepID=A0A6H0XRH8_9PEZI|nr:hypothetical protein AMS68_002765 [Peltaster fructicola]